MSSDFKPGDTVEYCGEQATVLANYGTSGTVEIPGEGRMSWYWVFDGEPVRLIRRAECTA